ncbi:MAG: helix-turn-helix domain-containing protein [Planctomycetaceae bacterium]|nr:helix-turn-helix domain-containing protein [Planctomycetaceae bacterium]
MSTEYYTLEKVSEILGIPTGEVNRLRERSELRAFRDGSSWKFRKTEVDNMLAEKIKSRSKQNNIADDDSAVADMTGVGLGEDDFDLLSDEVVELSAEDEQNTSAFDAAMEDGFELGEELIDAPAARTDRATNKPAAKSTKPAAKSTTENENVADDSSIFSLAEDKDDIFALADDDLVLADDQSGNQSEKLSVAKTSAPVAANNTDSKVAEEAEENDLIFATDDLSLAADDLSLADDDGLTLDESFTLAEEPDSANVISLAKSTNNSPNADSANKSNKGENDDELLKSFSDNVAEESDEKLFELEDDNASAKPAEEQVVFEQLNEDTDFLELINDDSPSDFADGAMNLTDEFKLTADGIGLDDESESTSQFIPLDEKNALSDGVFGDSTFSGLPSSDTESGMAGIDFAQQTTQTTNISFQQEVQYSPLIVGSLIAAAVLLIFPCVMLLDLISNIWGWNESIPINSPIMNLITGTTK